ncbi:MAG: GntR family transcriptional regulator [Burkholderiales bacterium]|nr:GntR family transcriptional regulator [Burkholderiales bacterium]
MSPARTRASALPFAPIAPDAAGMPLYRAVRRALLRAIEEGKLAPGAALPNEADLAGTFGVAVGTLRRAVDDLVAEHILVRRQGRGTFVATHTRDRFLFQFFHVERSDGLREAPTVELLGFERVRLDDDAAAALATRAGAPGFQFENRLALQGKAIVHDRVVVSATQFRGLTEKRLRERPSTIYHLYQSEFGVTVVRARERLRAALADRANARALGVSPGVPVLQVRRTAIALGGRPVEYRVSTIVTTTHDYVNQLSRPT